MYTSRFTEQLIKENRQLKKQISTYESDTAIAQMKAMCDLRVKGALDREKRNYGNWMKALEVNKELKKKNTLLWQEKEKYRVELGSIRKLSERLDTDTQRRLTIIHDLQDERNRLKEELAQKDRTITEKDKQIQAMEDELCRLKAQLDHDGTTNGIPTSQTPAGKKKVIPNTRGKTGRKKGGQPGHEKKILGAFEDEDVTMTEDHTLENCPECGGELEELGDDEDVVKDEADYEVKIIKKRHRFKKYQCKNCGKIVRAPIPQRLKEQNQYGPEVQALALSLVDMGFVSVSRTQEIVKGILHKGLAPSEGFVGKVQKKAARMLKGFYEEAKEFCLVQRILYWDDTVIFMNTARACFRFYGNEKVAFYTAHAAKDAKGIEADGILPRLTEKTYLMHDHVKYNYRKEFLFKNIECIQHMERELERVFRASGHKWAESMKKLIQEMIHKRKEKLKKGINSFTSEETNQIEEKLEQLMAQAYREHSVEQNRYFSTDEINAVKKLEEYRWNYFAWVYDFTLPTTNNLSESSLRMTKTKQKVSGQFLKEETASEFAVVRTYTETCRRNGIEEYEALKRLMAGNPYTIKEIISQTV